MRFSKYTKRARKKTDFSYRNLRTSTLSRDVRSIGRHTRQNGKYFDFSLCRCVASLSSIVLNRMGAVIREKSVLEAYCVRSLVDTRSVLTGDLQRKKSKDNP